MDEQPTGATVERKADPSDGRKCCHKFDIGASVPCICCLPLGHAGLHRCTCGAGAHNTSHEDMLNELLSAWDAGVTKWREHHESIPTAFVEMALVVDRIRSRRPTPIPEISGPKPKEQRHE